MNRPEVGNNHNEAERYLHSDLPCLSDNVDSEPLKISHARDIRMFLLQRKSPNINKSLFKMLALSTGLKSREVRESFNKLNSILNMSFIKHQSSQAGRNTFGAMDTEKPNRNNLSYLAQYLSNSDVELMKMAVSEYYELDKAVEASKTVT